MSPQFWREKLFRKSKPFIRQIVPYNEDGTVSDDIGILWAAYKQGAFTEEEISKEAFTQAIIESLSAYTSNYFIEDDNAKFRSKRGPVCYVGLRSDGWKATPKADVFPWATKSNILRCAVSFLHTIKHSREVGACEVRSLRETLSFLHKLKKYGVLFYVGKIPNGAPQGTEFIFSVRCKKEK